MPELTTADIAKIARADFYFYCQILKPRFYLPNRPHLKTLCNTLQNFAEGKIINKDGKPTKKLMLNLAPRHGKTLTVDMFSQWLLGHDNRTSIIRACYNETLSGRSAKTVRDGIQEVKAEPNRIVYSDIFPKTKIKYGDASYQMWSLEGSPFSFLATSPTGTMTGVGCKWGIIDDLIRDAKEAYNDRVLEEHLDWYANTYSSRLEAGARELLVMTRWGVNDLCGKLLAIAPDDWYVIKMPAKNEKGEMLCPDILDFETYEKRRLSPGTDPLIFTANYDQEAQTSKDRLYGEFKTYDRVEDKYDKIEAYFDTADEGNDYLAGGVVGIKNGVADLLDLIYTQDPMEVTERDAATMLTRLKCDRAVVEANSGGRGWARSVESKMRESGNTHTVVEWFHQTENKMARIISNSTSVTNCIRFPKGWETTWPQIYQELRSASRTRKMVHDDLEDFLTGIVEKLLVNRIKFEVW